MFVIFSLMEIIDEVGLYFFLINSITAQSAIVDKTRIAVVGLKIERKDDESALLVIVDEGYLDLQSC